MRWPTAVILLSIALAGCSDGESHEDLAPVQCPDGTTADPERMEGHHEEGFDAASGCPRPPEVTLVGLPAAATAYVPVNFTWAVDAGDASTKHTMDTQVRISASPADAAALAGPDSFGTQLAQRQHQDVPEPTQFPATLKAEEPGTYYLRAYAQVGGKDWWSEETVLNVTLAAPTGEVVEIVKAVGLVAGELTVGAEELSLGDAVHVKNSDVVPHDFTWTELPPGADLADIAQLARDGVTDDVVLVVPGTYELTDDGPAGQSKTVTFRVAA